ncbi:hypothetical protein DL96DRAFT_1614376, partial [Flagelloscypha sp. PMI_526]
MPTQNRRPLPPNAGLPADTWLQIIDMLPVQERIRLRRLNSYFWEAGLSAKYQSLAIGGFTRVENKTELRKQVERMKFYQNSYICQRIQKVEINAHVSNIWIPRSRLYSLFHLKSTRHYVRTLKMDDALVIAAESLVPKLVNVREIRIYASFNGFGGPCTKSDSYLRPLVLHCSQQLLKLELYLRNYDDDASKLLAEEMDNLSLSFPQLRHFTVAYHPYTSHIWEPLISKMLENSSDLRTLHICNRFSSYGSTFVPLSTVCRYPHLSVAEFTGHMSHQWILDFLASYGDQLKELCLDDMSAVVLSAAPLPLLQRLDIKCTIEVGYPQFLHILSQLPFLTTLVLTRMKVTQISALQFHENLFDVMLPSLQCLYISDSRIDLSWLRDLDLCCPNLKFLTFQAWSCIAHRSAHLYNHGWSFGRVNVEDAQFFALSLREAEPLAPHLKLETCYILFEERCLPASLVYLLPLLVPSLGKNPEKFYTDWRMKTD